MKNMRIDYVCGLQEDGAKFWLKRTGWKSTEVAKKIAQEEDPEEMGYIADIGGGHGRGALWLAEQGFHSILVEPNKYSLRLAKQRAKNKDLDIALISAALPYLPLCSKTMGTVNLYWTLHQIPDEHKLDSLQEIHRILKLEGTLYSTSFGYWEGQEIPKSIHPIPSRETFSKLHASAGFKPTAQIEKRSDSTTHFEKFWYGKFQKI